MFGESASEKASFNLVFLDNEKFREVMGYGLCPLLRRLKEDMKAVDLWSSTKVDRYKVRDTWTAAILERGAPAEILIVDIKVSLIPARTSRR